MPSFSHPELALIALAFFLAGTVKGVLGLGLPTVAIGLLGLLMPVAQAAALLIIPSLVTNIWQAGRGPHLRALLRLMWPMQVAVVLGVLAGAGWMHPEHARASGFFLGICLLVYGLTGLAGWRLSRPPPRFETAASLLAGGTTGLVTAATGIFALPAVPYLQALGLDKDQMSQALGVSFTVSTIALALILGKAGSLDVSVAGQSLLALLPALVGMAAGQAVRDKLSQAAFRNALFGGLMALGGWLLLRQLA